ncbi:MAG: tetratricopeptide repeat protein [Cytophagales bacterium]|nr:tetratricopeptide repeat protein [Bernardetiaceae bacterium]MDW8210342.1 tetratricopeptide repeat protein [Cytophagales bacterium]
MAKKEKTGIEIFESPEALQEQLSKTEQFARKNRKLVIGIGIGIAALALGIIGWSYYRSQTNLKAQVELFPAVFYLQKDSINKAVKGDNNNTTIGLEKIVEKYGNTKAGEQAAFYMGVISLRQGKYDEAINYLKNFDADDWLIQARAYSLIGDAYMEKKDLDNAIKYYKKAANHYPNDFFTPAYLLKLGLAYELKKDYASALMAYRTIVEKHRECSEFTTAEKKMARVEYLVNSGGK